MWTAGQRSHGWTNTWLLIVLPENRMLPFHSHLIAQSKPDSYAWCLGNRPSLEGFDGEICDYFASNIDNPNTKNEVLKQYWLCLLICYSLENCLSLSLYQNCSCSDHLSTGTSQVVGSQTHSGVKSQLMNRMAATRGLCWWWTLEATFF